MHTPPPSSPVYESRGGYLATDCPLCEQEVKAERNGGGWRFTCRGGHSDAEVRERLGTDLLADVLAELDRRREAKRRAALPDAEALAAMLGLDKAGLSIKGARIVGHGSAASADIFLSDGTTLTFDTLGVFGSPGRLAVEVVSRTGAPCPPMKLPEALKALGLLKAMAKHVEATTADDIAVEWGVSYLQDVGEVLDVNMSDQAERFGAFERLARKRSGVVLRDLAGTRYVRTGWFVEHARRCDHRAGSNAQIATRMERVGWERRGKTGRIKATSPSFPRSFVWAFFEVPAGWESAQGGDE